MTDISTTGGEPDASALRSTPPRLGQHPSDIMLFIAMVLMLGLAVIGVAYALSMMRFLADGGYFLSYGSLCSTVPTMAAADRLVPLLLAGAWLFCVYLGFSYSRLFYRVTETTALVSIAYGVAGFVMGPFTFRVGPIDVDPSTLRCGRWPIEIRTDPGLEVMQIEWLNVPISTFALSMVIVSLVIFVYLRSSKRVFALYRAAAKSAA